MSTVHLASLVAVCVGQLWQKLLTGEQLHQRVGEAIVPSSVSYREPFELFVSYREPFELFEALPRDRRPNSNVVLNLYREKGWVPGTTLAGRDDPEHREMRALFNHAFEASWPGPDPSAIVFDTNIYGISVLVPGSVAEGRGGGGGARESDPTPS